MRVNYTFFRGQFQYHIILYAYIIFHALEILRTARNRDPFPFFL